MPKTLLFFLLLLGYQLQAVSQKHLSQLPSKADFQNLSGLPISAKYGQIDALKVVYDLETETLYYLNAEHFEFHHEFCRSVLKNMQHLGTFNDCNYSVSDKRKYLLANINYVHQTQAYFLELSPSDLMEVSKIKLLYSRILESSFLDSSLAFILNSNRLLGVQNELLPIPLLYPSKLFESLHYQAIYKTTRKGHLRFIKDLAVEYSDINPTDIIVLQETPLTLPAVAGIIVCEFQTPLSHITLLGQNRDIPIMALKDAATNANLNSLANQYISLTIKADTFEVKLAEFVPEKSDKQKNKNLKFDLTKDSLLVLNKVHRRSYKYIGNKAYNFSELVYVSRNSNFKTPESAFAIPFFYYQKHVNQSHTQELINKLLYYRAHHTDIDSIKVILREIRNSIRYHPLDKNLANSVTNMAESLGDYTRFRFRSSTNAEDMNGFTGAGLYSSKTGVINDVNKPIDTAIKKVWASLWSFPAFMEREYYHINQRTVYMGILCHRAFPNEAVNGVAITKNLYRDSYFGYVVNAQLGNENVVKPSSGVICDQFVCYPSTMNNMYDENKTIEVITTSSLNNGQLVMTTVEIENLANQLHRIKQHFYNQTLQEEIFEKFAMDVEFKIDGDSRTLYIKQARRFNP